jgi:hypothetical protein
LIGPRNTTADGQQAQHESELGAEPWRILSRGRAITLQSVRAISSLAGLHYLVSRSSALTIHGSAAFSPPHFGHDVGGALVEGYSGDRDLRQAEVHARSQLFVLAVFSASVENSGSPHRRGDWTKQSDMDGSADILPIERGGQVRVLGDGDAAVSGFRDHRSPNLAPPLGHNMRRAHFALLEAKRHDMLPIHNGKGRMA